MSTHLVCTALVGTNKVGNLKEDEDGYFTVVLGALDVYNSAGAYYSPAGVDAVFNESGSLQRRVRTGNCRGEYGHPYRLPGQSIQEYMARCVKIQEDNIAFHCSEVWRDTIKDDSGRIVIAIMGKIKPCGPRGEILREQLKNPKENVCFSIRALTNDAVVNGVVVKVIRNIIGWDYVNEPGIHVASKYHNPTLESFQEDLVITRAMLKPDQVNESFMMSFESAVVGYEEILAVVNEGIAASKRPPSSAW